MNNKLLAAILGAIGSFLALSAFAKEPSANGDTDANTDTDSDTDTPRVTPKDVNPEQWTNIPGDREKGARLITIDDARLLANEMFDLTTQTPKEASSWKWKGDYDKFIYLLCYYKYRRIDPTLIKGIIHVESNFNHKAIGDGGTRYGISVGLMQVNWQTALWVAPFPNDWNSEQVKELLFHSGINIIVGTKYLLYQLARYKGNVEDAIAAYNSGTLIVSKTDPNVRVNDDYVQKVLRASGLYQYDFPSL